jgi:ribosome biogenesis GTPase
MTLEDLGWTDDRAEGVPEGTVPARVLVSFARQARLHDGARELDATYAGALRRAVTPVVGDWVAVRPGGAVEKVLPRRGAFTRRAAGEADAEQVLAANVDVAFLVMGLDRDYNLRRLERYLALTRGSGARAVIVLSKADLSGDLHARVAEVEAVAGGAPVLPARLLEAAPAGLAGHLGRGRTAVLLGSSGAGKSTLLNRLLGGEVQRTGAVRAADDRGKHTTTQRQLFFVPGGGMVIDSPGLREIQLWDADEALPAAFDDIEALAAGCRFRDCAHGREPGCAVRDAVSPDRLASYHKLRREVEHAAARQRDRERR